MRRWAALAWLATAGCGNLPEENGVAQLEVIHPGPVEVGQTIMLRARALDARGDSVGATITWTTPDTTVILTPEGRLTGRTGGTTARVQAQAGSLASDFVTVTVTPRPDTLAIAGDSVLTVAPGAAASAPLLASLRSLQPAGPLAGRTITYTVAAPVFADLSQRTVELPGGVLALAAVTGADGTPASPVTLNRVAGQPAPDSAIVTVTATTATGATVPGSGQRFVVHFQ